MNKHTPTPWKYVSGSMNNLRTVEYCSENHLGDAVQINIGHIHERKDAEFIANAVNSHKDLVKAVQDALATAEYFSKHDAQDKRLAWAQQAESYKRAIAKGDVL